MSKSLTKWLIISVVLFSLSITTFIAKGDETFNGEFPLFTKVFNKILYGPDLPESSYKTVEEMIADIDAGAVPFNAQEVCEDDDCYTWDAFSDKDLVSLPVSLADITRQDPDTGDLFSSESIDCGANSAIYDIDEIYGDATCTPIEHCYYTGGAWNINCIENYTYHSPSVCCTF